MTSEQWQRVKELFEEALECEPIERAAFLSKASEDDEVRREVESLLTAHENDSEFMNEPVGNIIHDNKPVLATGQRFGQYDDISLLGEGGMGQVYVAVDTRLGRKVALKLLPSSYTHDAERGRRLEQEARTTSALNHPNIVTIHEIGETDSVHFMATEFVEGQTLREQMKNGRMTLGEVVDVGVQVASALHAAHEAGIIHRDIKPENIMLRRDGVVKVLDFGLAKLIPQNGPQSPIRSLVNTHSGVIAGTVSYMSPEQTRGEKLDSRTDIWSLGVVLHELVTTHTPFQGETPNDVIHSIREKQPVLSKVEIPDALDRIIAMALRKDRTQRYQSAADLAQDLKNLKEELTIESRLKQFRNDRSTKLIAAPVSSEVAREPTQSTADFDLGRQKSRISLFNRFKHKALLGAILIVLVFGLAGMLRLLQKSRNRATFGTKSIAVFPLRPVDTSNRDEVYEIALTETLIHRIGLIDGLVVRPLNATRSYRDVTFDPIAAGKEQQVDFVLTASYQLAAGKIRVTAQLLNVAAGALENTYQIEKETTDMFAMEDAAANELGNRLLAKFGTTSRPPTAYRGTTNEEAYRLYSLGMYQANSRNLADGQKAIQNLEEAVRLDPNYARAWAGLAYAHRTLSLWTTSVSTHEAYQKSIEAIKRALSLDPNLSEAHSALCENKYLYEWDFAGAEIECRRAIQLDPNSSQAHEIFSRYLMGRGRHDEAIAEIKTAIDIDPSSRFFQRNYGRALFYARRLREASDQLKRVLAMDQNFVGTHSWLTSSLALQGNEEEAFEWFQRLLVYKKADDATVEHFKSTFKSSGWDGVLREWLKRFDTIGGNNNDGAAYNSQIRNKEEALQYLEKMYQAREIWLTYIGVDPRFDNLRDDPRFVDLLKRVDVHANQ